MRNTGVLRASLLPDDVHQQQRDNHGDITEAVDEEAITLAKGGDDDAGQRGADEPRSIHHRRVERDGVAQVGAVLHHLHHEGLPRGHIEGVDRALEQAERDDLSHGNSSAQRQCGQPEGLDHRQNLSDDQGAMTVQTIDPDARERPDEQERNLQREAGNTEQERRMREPVDQPGGGDARHPGTDQRDALSAEEEAVVAVAQSAHRKLPRRDFRSCRGYGIGTGHG